MCAPIMMILLPQENAALQVYARDAAVSRLLHPFEVALAAVFWPLVCGTAECFTGSGQLVREGVFNTRKSGCGHLCLRHNRTPNGGCRRGISP